MMLASVIVVLRLLIRTWPKFNVERRDDRRLLWASALSLTLVLNIYVPIYDTIIVVLSVLLTTDVLCRRAGDFQRALTPGYKFLLLLLYLVPWITQQVAKARKFQPYTLLLGALGIYQLKLLSARSDEPSNVQSVATTFDDTLNA